MLEKGLWEERQIPVGDEETDYKNHKKITGNAESKQFKGQDQYVM